MIRSSPVCGAGESGQCGGQEGDACDPTVLSAPLDHSEAAALAQSFAALADPVRLRLLSLLASAQAGEVCVCDFVAPLGKSQPTVSHHLKVLADAGLVSGERRGKWVWYSLDRGRLEEVRAALGSSGPLSNKSHQDRVDRPGTSVPVSHQVGSGRSGT